MERAEGVRTSRLYLDAPSEWFLRALSRFSASIERGFSGGPAIDQNGAVVAIASGRVRADPSPEAYGVSVLSLWNYPAFEGLEATPAGPFAVGDDELERLAAATVLPVSCGS